tara:strand:+ start:1475 stop:1615 length:141 start_codon:yes stop_codon:yes gene_type:complete
MPWCEAIIIKRVIVKNLEMLRINKSYEFLMLQTSAKIIYLSILLLD